MRLQIQYVLKLVSELDPVHWPEEVSTRVIRLFVSILYGGPERTWCKCILSRYSDLASRYIDLTKYSDLASRNSDLAKSL